MFAYLRLQIELIFDFIDEFVDRIDRWMNAFETFDFRFNKTRVCQLKLRIGIIRHVSTKFKRKTVRIVRCFVSKLTHGEREKKSKYIFSLIYLLLFLTSKSFERRKRNDERGDGEEQNVDKSIFFIRKRMVAFQDGRLLLV